MLQCNSLLQDREVTAGLEGLFAFLEKHKIILVPLIFKLSQ